MIYTERLIDVARRKERLLADCARRRAELVAELTAWRAPIAVMERSVAATRFIRAHPVAVAAVIAAMAVLGRRHLARWARRGILIWRGWRTIRTLLAMLSA